VREISLLDAPCNLGLRPPSPGAAPGAAKLASALRGRGLLEKLGARDAGRLTPPAYSPDPDPETFFRNGQGLKAFSPVLADHVGPIVESGRFALVLGGDCSVLIGSALGLKPLGRYGLVFIDAHDDFSVVRDLERYKGFLAAAGLDLGIVTGRAPGGLGDLRGCGPYVREEDVVLLGLSREEADTEWFATEVFDTTAMHQIPVQRIRERGSHAAARDALAFLDQRPLDGFWIHLDVDVLDAKHMPAVDSPNPDGLDYPELEGALRVLLADPKAVGMDLTIYDPELDPEGTYGDRLAEMLIGAFAR